MESTMKTYHTDKTSMFITNPNPKADAITFDNSDVQLVHSWQAHKNQINCITWVPELSLVTSCSYDCNVFMWNTNGEKIGSLVLGNKATAPDQKLDPETARYRRGWKIVIDKVTHYKEELAEADGIWKEVSLLN
jgi:WD40 repeat protein